MKNRTDQLLTLANSLQNNLYLADKLNASFAAIKILEAHEAILELVDETANMDLATQKTLNQQMSPVDRGA